MPTQASFLRHSLRILACSGGSFTKCVYAPRYHQYCSRRALETATSPANDPLEICIDDAQLQARRTFQCTKLLELAGCDFESSTLLGSLPLNFLVKLGRPNPRPLSSP